jgi:alpha-1,3/alpha-1,6-mannosyltransferase
VRFLASFSDAQRRALLASCAAVVYTPQHEHFGIVPLEAMAVARPVVAVNSGGPTESVVHGESGLLCDPTPSAFASAYKQLLCDGGVVDSQRMGAVAGAHVQARFSREAFGARLLQHVQRAVGGNKGGRKKSR